MTFPGTGSACPFDSNLVRKPAYFGIVAALKGVSANTTGASNVGAQFAQVGNMSMSNTTNPKNSNTSSTTPSPSASLKPANDSPAIVVPRLLLPFTSVLFCLLSSVILV
jgi:endo-1,4-beta-xylanase